MKEKRIWHYLYGEGILVETRHRGLQLIAQFRDGVKRLVRGEDVQKFPSDGGNGHGNSLDETIEVHNFGPENYKSRAIIEALRLGVDRMGRFGTSHSVVIMKSQQSRIGFPVATQGRLLLRLDTVAVKAT